MQFLPGFGPKAPAWLNRYRSDGHAEQAFQSLVYQAPIHLPHNAGKPY